MAINKLVDPGEVYVIGQYEFGTNNPTGLYKIGIVQNERSTYQRLPEHQTGNPNRLFIAEHIPSEASYLVEQQMHRKWNSKRVSQEWFDLSAPGDYAQVVADIHSMEGQFGPQIAQLRNVYYQAPITGNNSTLSAAAGREDYSTGKSLGNGGEQCGMQRVRRKVLRTLGALHTYV